MRPHRPESRTSERCATSDRVRCSSCCGFTLLELLVVLLVMGIAAGIAGVIISKKSGGVEIMRVSREISATLRVARSRAVSEKTPYYFVLSNRTGSYGLYNFSMDLDDNDRMLTEAIPEEIWKVTYNEAEENMFQIEFTPLGSSSGGVLEIRDDSRKYRISINRLTGRVRIEKTDI